MRSSSFVCPAAQAQIPKFKGAWVRASDIAKAYGLTETPKARFVPPQDQKEECGSIFITAVRDNNLGSDLTFSRLLSRFFSLLVETLSSGEVRWKKERIFIKKNSKNLLRKPRGFSPTTSAWIYNISQSGCSRWDRSTLSMRTVKQTEYDLHLSSSYQIK